MAHRRSALLLALAALVTLAAAEVYFVDKFDDGDAWTKRWTKSSWKTKDDEAGAFTLTAGKWYGDAEEGKGLQTGPDSKFIAYYAEMKKSFDNTKKDLVLQFQVKHEQDLDCGGGYIKLVPASSKSKMKDFGGDTPYSIMFGPDICGYSTKKVHAILTYKDKNHLIKTDVPAKSDTSSHVYTLHIMPDNTYTISIDYAQVANGSLYEDWDMLAPKMIKDPKATKPEDWDEREQIPDPEDKKPDGYDDIPASIADPEAKKPEDWSDDDDGEWEPPMIPNPEFKGEWKPNMIDNPAYKGKWEAPDIDNPDYKHDDMLYRFKDLKYIGFELWQVKSGSIFDNIIVTDDPEAARKLFDETWAAHHEAEEKMMNDIKEEERKAKEAEAKESGGGGDAGDMPDLPEDMGGDEDYEEEGADAKEEL